MPITDWPADERPREKLLLQGATALSDAELLAIFLRTGLPGKSAVDLARELLAHFGSLNGLFQANQSTLTSVNGMGEAKYAQLQAILEMSRRALKEELRLPQAFSKPQLVKDYLQLWLGGETRECFAALFLDSQHGLIASEVLFHGTLDQAAVHPREIAKRALELNAAAIIVAHNHPSGHPEPSQADVALTEQLRRSLALLDIRLLDHFIATRRGTVSLAERGDFLTNGS
ncbi:RadC family protein [Chitinimonas sp.]|uniref:RadC family protein n=1 Tax=Chitinimonas sp. TaxID=1934313 RepID=UPI002F92269F